MIQLSLDAPLRALARTQDPATSHAAAARVDAPKISDLVLAELRAHGPGTSHDLAARLGLSLVTVSPRLKPLELAGKVERRGTEDKRTVWAARG